ncbi:Mnn2p [Sugiyamaella lignohabitans]|uniref:Mnn2p n=1 Tax=Sugiyamaella lignohabitans TaxID=796027 RepID=A0A167EN45_9ASCO|nr:Mnn2p [Sugiyamaella lignohabitans]ANB14272.1 Mnn2p [Sugiyamaella lignohabitans]
MTSIRELRTKCLLVVAAGLLFLSYGFWHFNNTGRQLSRVVPTEPFHSPTDIDTTSQVLDPGASVPDTTLGSEELHRPNSPSASGGNIDSEAEGESDSVAEPESEPANKVEQENDKEDGSGSKDESGNIYSSEDQNRANHEPITTSSNPTILSSFLVTHRSSGPIETTSISSTKTHNVLPNTTRSPTGTARRPSRPFEPKTTSETKTTWAQIEVQRILYIRSLLSIFEDNRPNIEPLNKYKYDKTVQQSDEKSTKEELSNFLVVGDDDKAKLTESHRNFVKSIPSSYPEGMFNGSGVVFTSGGAYLPVMVAALKMLRRVSPDIPVEVFMANKDEYEPDICSKVLPSLGARCFILQDVYGDNFFRSFDIHSYQFKSLAILASSFENVIFMDSDNMLFRDVEQSLHQEPFNSTGYVVWPDYWDRTVSPDFYDIAGIELGDRVRGDLSITDPNLVPEADLENAIPNKTSESGQLMISKSKHYKTLLLSIYYNLNGFNAYYKLLSQGGPGEGDKETYIAAARALNATVHQIKSPLITTGMVRPNGIYKGVGMMQALPYDDYEKHVLKAQPETWIPRILFVHFNVFKLNLRLLLEGEEKDVFQSDETRIRFCGPAGKSPALEHQDFELLMWREVVWEACDMPKMGANFRDWKDADMSYMCSEAARHYAWLVNTTNSA